MSTVSEALSLLEKIPQWKRLMDLAPRLDAIEKRLADIEQRLAGGGKVCPRCSKLTFELLSTKPHPVFGVAGAKEMFYRCSQCGFEETEFVEK